MNLPGWDSGNAVCTRFAKPPEDRILSQKMTPLVLRPCKTGDRENALALCCVAVAKGERRQTGMSENPADIQSARND